MDHLVKAHLSPEEVLAKVRLYVGTDGSVAVGASCKRKKNWEVSAALEGNSYDFFLASGVPQNAGNDSSNDKKRYYAKLSGEKLFLDGDLVLSLDLKYRYTDYEQKDDTEQEAVRAAFKYKF